MRSKKRTRMCSTSCCSLLDAGRLTDSTGRTVDFKNTVVIMTSNVGSQYIEAMPVGASQHEQDALYEKMKAKVTEQLRQHFRPELLNRIDEIIVFHALNQPQITQIVDLLLKGTERQLAARKLSLEVTDAAKTFIALSGFDPLYGARPLRRDHSAHGGEPDLVAASCAANSGTATRSW